MEFIKFTYSFQVIINIYNVIERSLKKSHTSSITCEIKEIGEKSPR